MKQRKTKRADCTLPPVVRPPQSDNILEMYAEISDPARWAAMMLTTKPMPPGTTTGQAQDIVVDVFGQAITRAHGDLVRDNEKLRKALREVADWLIDKQHFEHAEQIIELLKTCKPNISASGPSPAAGEGYAGRNGSEV